MENEKLNNLLSELPIELEKSLEGVVNDNEYGSLKDIPVEYVLEEAKYVLSCFQEDGHELNSQIEGDYGEEKQAYAEAQVQELEEFIERFEEEITSNKYSEGSINGEGTGNSSSSESESTQGDEKEMATTQKPEVIEKPKQKENTYDSFKWLNRPKATMLAVEMKNEESISAEEACKRVLKEYEGVYFFNPELMSEKRKANFVQRVEANKSYKKSKGTIPAYIFTQSKIELLKEQGSVTELQAVVLDYVFNELASQEVGFSDLDVMDIAEGIGLKQEQVKGALGHLTKKGYVEAVEQQADLGEGTPQKLVLVYIKAEKYELYNDDIFNSKKEGVEALLKQEDEEIGEDEENAVLAGLAKMAEEVEGK